jgi:hypothetical protein
LAPVAGFDADLDDAADADRHTVSQAQARRFQDPV